MEIGVTEGGHVRMRYFTTRVRGRMRAGSDSERAKRQRKGQGDVGPFLLVGATLCPTLVHHWICPESPAPEILEMPYPSPLATCSVEDKVGGHTQEKRNHGKKSF